MLLNQVSKIACFFRFRPANENKIYKALQVLDAENKGYYTKEDLVRLMTSEGKFRLTLIFKCSANFFFFVSKVSLLMLKK